MDQARALSRRIGGLLGAGAAPCSHLDQARMVAPLSDGCRRCLVQGSAWVHLRLCLSCGEVACCDQSPNRHAREHHREAGHPIVRSHEPGETWSWCWIDEVML